MELINTHCHTGYCGHAEGTVAEYVAQAKKEGLTTLAFTDHYPLTPAFDPDKYLCVQPEDLPAYEADVLKAREENPDIEILLGCEYDYLGDTDDRNLTAADFEHYDIVLGSVHFVDRWPFDDPAQRDAWNEDGAVDRIWRRYVDLWCDLATDKSIPVDVMSHPDLAKKFSFYPSYGLEPLYKQMAEAASAGGRMVEVNTSGSYYACKEIFPAPALLREFCKAGVPCTVGTDAHDPMNVARDLDLGYKLMRDAGYDHITVPTLGGDRRTISLNESFKKIAMRA